MLARIRLDRDGARPLHEQLIARLRGLILGGELPPGTRLPPTRRAAVELGVSRNVVVLAYEQLRLEGCLEARVGSGTRVPDALPVHLLRPVGVGGSSRAAPAARDAGGGDAPAVRLSRQGAVLAAARRSPRRVPGPPGAFVPGVVAPEYFPAAVWARLSGRLWRTRAAELVGYGDAAGWGPLREAIADHVRRYRAVHCTAEQVVVTSGSQQALDLVARVLVDPGDAVLIEEPGYRGARQAFAAVRARLVPVAVDAEGIEVPAGRRAPRRPRVLYLSPSHQYPLGVTLSLARRLRLLEWAATTGAWIVEDDYDSEFRYASRPLPSLQGLDADGRVIYVGTLSKVLAPGLRLGFLVLPAVLVAAFRGARSVLDSHSPLILQATLAAFMADGHLERHVARLRGVYGERRRTLRTALAAQLDGRIEIPPGEAGLHLTALLPRRVDDRAIADAAARAGIEAPPLSEYCMRADGPRGLVLGYGAVAAGDIVPAVERLAAIVRRLV